MVVTTLIAGRIALRPMSVAGLALVPRGTMGGYLRRAGRSDDRMLHRAF
jgi:hypothetical protein